MGLGAYREWRGRCRALISLGHIAACVPLPVLREGALDAARNNSTTHTHAHIYTRAHSRTHIYTRTHSSTTGEGKKPSDMDDPLTKWLHLHSNINNTAGTVSAPQQRVSPPFYWNAASVVLTRLNLRARLCFIGVMRGIFSLDFQLLSARAGWSDAVRGRIQPNECAARSGENVRKIKSALPLYLIDAHSFVSGYFFVLFPDGMVIILNHGPLFDMTSLRCRSEINSCVVSAMHWHWKKYYRKSCRSIT